MATQTVQIQAAISGETSTTLKAFPIDSDTESGSVASTEATNRQGLYVGAFTDLAAGVYRFELRDSAGEALTVAYQALTLTTDTFQAYESYSAAGGDGTADVIKISGSTSAADRLESILLDSNSADGYIAANVVQATVQAANIVTGISSGTITQQRGDDWSFSLAGLGNITGNSKVWLTVKTGTAVLDQSAVLQIEKAGLLIVNGSAGTAANATLTVTDATAGDITVTCKAEETAKLEPTETAVYDVQWKNSSGSIETLTSGTFKITGDVTRATE